MEYNKDKFIKTNDKKVLHKVKKQWVVLSMSLLALLGGGAVAHQAAAHADSANRQNANPAAALKDRINVSLMKAQSNSHQTSAAAQTQGQSQASVTNIRQQAVQLHNRIVSNAVLTDSQSQTNHEIQNSSSIQRSNSSIDSASSGTNYQNSVSVASSYNSQSISSASVSTKQSNNINTSNVSSANRTLLKANEQLDPSQHLVSSDKITGTYRNLEYISDGYKNIEFFSGTLSNGSNFLSGSNTPSDIKYAQSIKFDSDVDTSQMTDASGMFAYDDSLDSVMLPSDFGQNITNASSMFAYNDSLDSVMLPSMFAYNDSLDSVMLPSGFGQNITNASGMFSHDDNLVSVMLPSDFGQNITNASNMFRSSNYLSNITLPSDFGQNITNASNMFGSDGSFANRSDNFSRLQMDNSGTPADPHHLAGHWIDVHSYHNLEYTSDGNGDIEFFRGTLSNGSDFAISNAPSDISQASSVKFDSDVDTSQLTDASNMFKDSKKLSSITLPSGFGQNITNASNMFGSDGSFANRSDNFSRLQMDNSGTPADPHHLAGHWVDVHNYRNLKYTRDGNGDIEFFRGTLSNGSDFAISNAPSDISQASSVKFDSDVDTSQLTYAFYMFGSDHYLNNLILSAGFGQNIVNAGTMFSDSVNLNNLTLPAGFGQKISDAEEMFRKVGCDLALPVGFGQNIVNATDMFNGGNFGNLTLPTGFGQKISDANGMFDNTKLDSLTLPAGFGQSIVNANKMFDSDVPFFNSDDNLNQLHLNHNDTPMNPQHLAGHWITNVYQGMEYVSDDHGHVTFTKGTLSNGSDFMTEAPSDIQEATSIKFDSDVDSSQLTNASNMFSSDSNLTNVIFPSDFGQDITNASGMFRSDVLKNLILPNGFGQNITNAYSMFCSDHDLVNLILPDGFGQNINNKNYMFSHAPSFYRLRSDGNTSDQLNSDSDLIENISDLAGHWIDHQIQQYDGLTYKYDKDTDTIDFTKGKLNWNGSQGSFLENAPSVIQNASTIRFDGDTSNSDQPNSQMDLGNLQDMANMFASDRHLQHLDLNANFKQLKPTNLFNAFGEDPSLQSVDLSKLDTSQVTDMSNLFAGDYGLQSINFGNNWNTSDVTDMAAMFMDDRNLTSLDLSHFDTSKVKSMLEMFSGDEKLASLNVSRFNTSQVGNMGAMFYDLPALKSLNLANFDTANVSDMNSMFALDNLSSIQGLKQFNTSQVHDMNNMFFQMPQLKDLDVSNFDTRQVSDMLNMFGADVKLSDLTLGSRFTTQNVANDKWMFQLDNNLKQLQGVPSGFRPDKSAMLSSATHQVSTTLANLGNQQGQTVMEAIQAHEPLVGDWFSSGTDTLEYYLGNKLTSSDIVSSQVFHGEKNQPDYTLMEMTSDTLFGLDTSKYYLTGYGNNQIANLAYDKNLKFNGTVIPVQVAHLQRSYNTINYTYNNQVIAHVTLSGTKATSDTEMLSDLHAITRGDFVGGNGRYGLTDKSKSVANQLAERSYEYDGSAVTIPVNKISSNEINYVNSDNQTVNTQTFSGLNKLNDPYVDQVMRSLLASPSDLSFLNNGMSDYILSAQGIQDVKNALPPSSLHSYGDDQEVTIHVSHTAYNQIICVNSLGKTLMSDFHQGRPGSSDQAMKNRLNGLLASSDGHGNYYYDRDNYLAANKGVRAIKQALNNCRYDNQTVTIQLSPKQIDSMAFVYQGKNINSYSDIGIPGHQDADFHRRLQEIAAGQVEPNSDYYIPQNSLNTVKAALNHNYDYQSDQLNIQVERKRSDVIQYSDHGIIHSDSYRGIPGSRDSDVYNVLNDLANGDLNIDVPNTNNDYYVSDSGIKQAKADLKNHYDHRSDVINIPVEQEQDDAIRYVVSDSSHADNGETVNWDDFQGIPGKRDQDINAKLAELADYPIEIGSDYYVSPQGMTQAKQAENNGYDYNNGTVQITVKPQQHDYVEYVLSDAGQPDNNHVIKTVSYQGIPGQQDDEDQGLLNDIASGELDSLDSDIYRSDPAATKQDAENALQHPLDFQNGVIPIRINKVQYGTDTINFYYQGSLVGSRTSPRYKTGTSDDNQESFDGMNGIKDASRSTLDGWMNSDYYVDDDEMNAFDRYAFQKGHFQFNSTVYNMDVAKKPNDIDTLEFVDSDDHVVSKRSWSNVIEHADNHPMQVTSKDDLSGFDPTGTGKYQLSVKGQYELADVLNNNFDDLDFAGGVLKVNVKPKQFATFTAIYTVNGRPKFKTVVTGLRGYRVDGKDYLNRQVDETLNNGDQVYLGPEFNLPTFDHASGGLMVDPMWHSANGIHYTFENNMITIPLVSREVTNRFVYKDSDNHIVYIANLTGKTDSYPSNTTTNKNGVPMPVGIPNLNDSTSKVGSDTPFPDVLKQYDYSPAFRGIKSARFKGSTYFIGVQKKPSSNQPQLDAYNVNYVNKKDQVLGHATMQLYSDTIKAIQTRHNNLTSSSDNPSDKTFKENLAATISNLGGLPDINGVPASIDDSDVINGQPDQASHPYSINLNVVPTRAVDHIRFLGDDQADHDVKGLLNTNGHVDAPAGFYFITQDPTTNQPLANNNGDFTFNDQTHTFYVAPVSNLIIPIVFYQNGGRSDVVARDDQALRGKTGHKVPVYYQYVQNHLPKDYRIASDGDQIINDLNDYTVGTNLSDQYGLYGGTAQNNNSVAVTPIYIPVTNRARLTIQYQDVSRGRNQILPTSDNLVDGSHHVNDQMTVSDLRIGLLRLKTGTIYHLQSGYQPPKITSTDQLITVPVVAVPQTDQVKFVLSKAVPQSYSGPKGVIASDDSDYVGTGSDQYTFLSGKTSADGIKGLPANYHIVKKQTIHYNGLIYRIPVAPNLEHGTVNYVYTDHKGTVHTVASAPLVGTYGCQIRISGRAKVPNGQNPNSLLNSVDQLLKGTWIHNNSEYQLVNQGVSDNEFLFGNGQVMNADKQEVDDPASPDYNPSNNVFNVPVIPAKAAPIDIDYINETGQQLGFDHFSGGYGDNFTNVTSYTDEHNSSYSSASSASGDHIMSDNPDSNDYNVDLSQQELNNILDDYKFDSDTQVITVPLSGKSNASQVASKNPIWRSNSSNAVTVNIKKVNSDDSQIGSLSSSVVYLHGDIGSFVSLKPSDLLSGGSYYDSNLSDYQVSPNTAAGSNYYLSGDNQSGSVNGTLYQTSTEYVSGSPRLVPGSNAEPASLTFTYESKAASAGTITVIYKDDQTGSQVGTTDVISPAAGTDGQKINVIDSNSKLPAVGGKTDTGENIPPNYTLADENMPNTIYTVNSHPQTVILYVHNDNQKSLTTNGSNHQYPLMINLREQLYINGSQNNTKNSDGWHHGVKWVTVQPHVSANLQKQALLRSPSYTPTENNSTVVPQSNESDTIQFDSDTHALSNVKPNGISPSDGYTVDDNGNVNKYNKTGIVFNYNVYAKGTTQYRNRIHYVSYSDMDNEADITKLFNHPSDPSNFLTTVSDAGQNGQPFNDRSYRANVPKGYQFYRVFGVNSDDGGKETADTGLTTFGKSRDQDEYIEVIPNASSINVHYVDQNGQQIAEHTFSGQSNLDGHGHGYTSKFGQFVPETGSDSIEKNSDINLISPDAQYKLKAQPYHTADGSVDHNSTLMFGRQPQDVKVTVVGKQEDAAPLTVKYINQAGALVGYQSFVGRYNDAVNVVGDHDQNVPSNYSLNDNQVTNYHFGKGPQTIYLGVTGKQVTPDVTIEEVMKQSNGMQKIRDTKLKLKPSQSHRQGSDIEINPNDYTPSGYAPDYNHDSVQFITMNATKGAMPDKIVFYYDAQKTNAAPIVLRYINQVGHVVGAAQVLNGDIGDQITVGNGKVQFSDNNQGTNDETLNGVPHGYKLTDSSRTVAFTDSPQTLTVKVRGQYFDNLTLNLQVQTESDDGSHAVTRPVSVVISGRVGSDFHISPYGFKVSDNNDHVISINGSKTSDFNVPKGYHAISDDSDLSGVINSDGQLSTGSDHTYIYQANDQSTAPLDKVVVHYVTSDSGAKDINGKSTPVTVGSGKGQVKYYQIDQESDSGYDKRDQFDLTPYLHDLPESVAQFYDIDGSAVNKSNQSVDDQWTFGKSNVRQNGQDANKKSINNIQDVYIKIHQNDRDQPIVVD